MIGEYSYFITPNIACVQSTIILYLSFSFSLFQI